MLCLEQLFDTNLKITQSTLTKVVTNRSGRVAKLLMSGKNKSFFTNSWIMGKLCLAAVGLRRRLKQTKIFRDYQLDTVISDLQYEAIAGILRTRQGKKGETEMGEVDCVSGFVRQQR